MSNFASFKQSFRGNISTPTYADYAQAISHWALNAQANAKIVTFVKTPKDVTLAIAYARENSLLITIRGGGHNTAGASSTKGLVIDLSCHLNTVEINLENKLAYVDGGAIWEQVEKAAIQHGLATVAGMVNHVSLYSIFPFAHIFRLESEGMLPDGHILQSGVYFSSRLTLGGGIGQLSGEHGLVIDNLIKVVLFP